MTRHLVCHPSAVVVIALAAVALACGNAVAVPGAGLLVREAVEMAARKSGRELVERSVREGAEAAVERGVVRHGARAAQAVADGGLELVEASARYGDDVMRVAVEASPAARRALALEPGRIMPLARELGAEAVEIEARSPGLARRFFTTFGDDGARQIARNVPAEDMPRLLAYGERADTPATRRLLIEVYEKEGPAVFQRIPPQLVLSTGLTTAMIYGTHRLTAPLAAAADAIGKDPRIAGRFADGLLLIGGLVALVATVFVLGAFRLAPWHARSRAQAAAAASPRGQEPAAAYGAGPADAAP